MYHWLPHRHHSKSTHMRTCILHAEAVLMDPQQRLLMEVTEEALTTARLSVLGAVTGKRRDACSMKHLPRKLLPSTFASSAVFAGRCCALPNINTSHAPCLAVGEGVGVFVGISTPDYSTLAQAAAEISAYSATGEAGGAAEGRHAVMDSIGCRWDAVCRTDQSYVC